MCTKAIRLLYGLRAQGWLESADHLAWSLLIEEAALGSSISYDQLHFYPYLGGTVWLSLLALGLHPWTLLLPSLSWVALIVDTCSRLIQITLVHRIFGRVTALYYGIWTVLAIPFLLPWATVNFSLHVLSSFWPFVFLYAWMTPSTRFSRPVLCGGLCGLALTWSYNSLVFIPVYWVWVMISEPNQAHRWREIVKFTVITALFAMPHVIMRWGLDLGFLLYQTDPISVRGISIEDLGLGWGLILNPIKVWLYTLPGASSFPAVGWLPMIWSRILWAIICLIGLGLAVYKNLRNRSVVWLSIIFIAAYFIIYAISPFFYPSARQPHYAYYRHIGYILPLLGLVVIHGFMLKTKRLHGGAVLWIIYCMIGSVVYIAEAQPPVQPAYRGCGWTLAHKLGHEPVYMPCWT